MVGECIRRESAEAEQVAEAGKEKGSGLLDPNPFSVLSGYLL
jgi:hypothetical protein